MKNKTKKILAGVGLGLVGMGCLTGCNAEEIKIPTDYNVTTPTDYNVTVNQEKQYRLTVINDSDNGTIYPNLSNETCSVMVEEGDDYTFTIRAKEGYKLDNLLIDGELVEPREIYTFENVDADHSIGAVYSIVKSDSRMNIKSLILKGMTFKTYGDENISVGDKIYFNIIQTSSYAFGKSEIMLDKLCDVINVSAVSVLDGLKTISVKFDDLPNIEFSKNGYLGLDIYSKDRCIVSESFSREDIIEDHYGDSYCLENARSYSFWFETESGSMQLTYSDDVTNINLYFEATYYE